jgi:hypothetical protein
MSNLTPDNWIKIVAVAVGGAWTYLNYVRGRTFRKRLDVELPGSIGELNNVLYFSGQCKAKNVGSSHIPIIEYGTGVSIFSLWLQQDQDSMWKIAAKEIIVLPLIEKDAWIEPGETFSKPYIIALPHSEGHFVGSVPTS